MTALFPSIQSFYSRELSSSSPNSSDAPIPAKTGDGFTSSEVEAALDPLSRPWEPIRPYQPCPIALLQGGAHDYRISGRIVNFSTVVASSPGYISYSVLVVTDGSAAIAIKLYYPNPSDYHLLLGQRITVWTTYIVESGRVGNGSIPFCFSATTIHPGRNGATHIAFHVDTPGSEDDRSLRRPLEADQAPYDGLPDLMTLKAFISSGYDFGQGRILVCVCSIGPRRTISSRKQQAPLDLVEVSVFDDTANCILKLWKDKVASAKTWVPNKTILLISKPTSRIPDRSSLKGAACPEIGIGYNSMVDVDPEFAEASWLREKVREMSTKECVYIPFPAETWDIDRAMNGPGRTLFTLGDVEDQVRHQDTKSDFTGKLNVIILEIHLMDQWRKGRLCCFECCGIPLYANKPVATCKNCGCQRELVLNPRIIGSMIDETGTVTSSKLSWNDEAWAQLFFGSDREAFLDGGAEANLIDQCWADITVFDANSLRYMEDQLLYSRITLTFGWSSELSRLCILGVEW